MLKEHRLNNLYIRYGAVFFLLFFALSWQPVAAADESDVKQLIKLAKSGDADAQYELALSYRDGKGVKQSDRKAAKWLLKAYKKGGNLDAAVDLGDMYMLERGFNIKTTRNLAGGERHYVDKAMKLYRKSAEMGSPRGKFRLGSMLMPSNRVDGSLVYKAWTNAKTVYVVPNVHLSKTFPRAEKWLQASADDGYAEAQYMLARIYTENKFGPDRKRKAVGLYEAAAKQGHFQATYDLAVVYAQGRLGTVNLTESYAWFSIADKLAEKNSESKSVADMHVGVQASLNAVLNAMEPAELSMAERLVKERLPAILQSVLVF